MNYLNNLPNVEKLNGKKAIFLLGTDQNIGEGLDEHGNAKKSETRVGIVPDQVEAIRNWLESNGVALDFFFVKGAGTRADFLDSAYLKIGGQVLFEHQLSTMPSPDVVHALKEPCAYETFIPGPFLRIGALHSGAFTNDSGVAFLFKRRNFSAIFDGSNVGDHINIPIRGSMSPIAGEIAAERAKKHLDEQSMQNGKVVISGGGVVGKSALNEFIRIANNKYAEILLVELNKTTLGSLKETHKDNEKVTFVEGNCLTEEHISKAHAVILTAVKDNSAPDVLNFSDIGKMSDNSIIVDVSIDERGGIDLENFDRKDKNFSLAEVVKKISDSIEELEKGIKYIADDHLPMYRPKPASIAHGEAVMPYIAMLLYCSAKLGGARPAARYVLESDFDDQPTDAKVILNHLRRGLAFYSPVPIRYNNLIIKDTNDAKNKSNFEDFFNESGIEFDIF